VEGVTLWQYRRISVDVFLWQLRSQFKFYRLNDQQNRSAHRADYPSMWEANRIPCVNSQFSGQEKISDTSESAAHTVAFEQFGSAELISLYGELSVSSEQQSYSAPRLA
jgi:hypothetical protein